MFTSETMEKLSAILFPHASLPEETLKRALSFFGPIKICQPWSMVRAVSFSREGMVQILLPPLKLKPSTDLEKLLSEYRSWVSANQKRGLDAWLAFSDEKLKAEETVWDIRGSLRSKQTPSTASDEGEVLKWNAMLHMAQEIEDRERETSQILRDLRRKSPPLKDLLEEEAGGVHPLKDLHPFDKAFTKRTWDHVVEAWMSLFEGYLEEDDFLLTFSEEIFRYLEEEWEEVGNQAHPLTMEVRSPDFSGLTFEKLAEAKGRWLESEEGIALRDRVVRLREGSPVPSPKDSPDVPGFPGKMIKIILRFFPRVPFSGGLMSRFSGRTVAWAREEDSQGG